MDKPIDQQITSLATRLAAAYWRGRLETIKRDVAEEMVFEAMIKEAALYDTKRWIGAATSFLV